MMLGRYKQRPRDIRLREVDYTDFLEEGETISTIATEVDPVTDTPFSISGVTVDVDGKKFAYVSQGGDDGYSYSVTFEINTSAGQRKCDTIEFDVEEDV